MEQKNCCCGEKHTVRSKEQKKALMNIAQAGVFSADRAVKEYAEHIWHINPVTETDGIDGTDEA